MVIVSSVKFCVIILEKEFAQWKTDKVKSASQIIEGQSRKVGEDCK
jgi:hypothetical protein